MRAALTAVVFFLLAVSPLHAGGDVRDLPPRAAGMGGAGCALQASGLSMINPALLSTARCCGELYWTPQRFGMSELGSIAAGWVQPYDDFSASIHLQRFGYDMYNEHRLDVSWATAADSSFHLGLRLAAHTVSIARYGSSTALGLDLGAQIRLTDALSVGAVVWNAVQQGFTEGERLPVSLRSGIAWHGGRVRLAVDAESVMRQPLSLRLGIECALHECVQLRMGIVNAPAMYTTGASVALDRFVVHYAVSVHPDLGWTHTAGIGFRP